MLGKLLVTLSDDYRKKTDEINRSQPEGDDFIQARCRRLGVLRRIRFTADQMTAKNTSLEDLDQVKKNLTG